MCCKMKRIIFTVFLLFNCFSVNAASMCLPQASSVMFYTTTDFKSANNRGEFALNGVCTADNTTSVTRHLACTTTPTERGESHCSASGTYPADNWEQGGKYCWCRLTGIKSTNGYMAPRNGGWVFFAGYFYSTDFCGSHCANYCARETGASIIFRRTLYATTNVQ